MNERIKELAEQAERLAEDELAHLERVHNRLYSFTEGREIYNQKFAQLIVKECADVAKETRWAVPPSQEQIARGIQQHFGVEE